MITNSEVPCFDGMDRCCLSDMEHFSKEKHNVTSSKQTDAFITQVQPCVPGCTTLTWQIRCSSCRRVNIQAEQEEV